MPQPPLESELRALVDAIEATGRALLPSADDELLQSIVEAAARIFGAAAASIALVDERAGQLVFRVAYGAGSETVIGMRIGLDQGIAGYVANTGQPIAISNVQSDTRFSRGTAEQTGYVPRSILAMPLITDERVIGVMEVLDKLNAASFGMQDMELLGMFARQAAIAIHQSQHLAALNDVLVQNLQGLVTPEQQVDLTRALRGESEPRQSINVHDEVLELAEIFRAVAVLGDAERRLCLDVLRSFARYAKPAHTENDEVSF